MIRPIPFRRPSVLSHLGADILNATEDRKHLGARPAVPGSKPAREALSVAKVSVDDQQGQLRSANDPAQGDQIAWSF